MTGEVRAWKMEAKQAAEAAWAQRHPNYKTTGQEVRVRLRVRVRVRVRVRLRVRLRVRVVVRVVVRARCRRARAGRRR